MNISLCIPTLKIVFLKESTMEMTLAKGTQHDWKVQSTNYLQLGSQKERQMITNKRKNKRVPLNSETFCSLTRHTVHFLSLKRHSGLLLLPK